MQSSLWPEKLAASLVMGSLVPLVFFGVSGFNQTRTIPAPSWIVTPVDALGVVPIASLLYVSWYAAPALLLLLPRREFWIGIVAELLTFGVCVIGFIALPIAIDRPINQAPQGVGRQVLELIYAYDPPVNLFPSFHAAVAVLIAGVAKDFGFLARTMIRIWMFGVCLSCVLTKQHFAADVLAGGLVGYWVLAYVRYSARAFPAITMPADAASSIEEQRSLL